jgi:putative Holliday junction resolvase
MSRILCIDYGKKRTGIAVTDPLKIIATALITVQTKELISFLKKYFQQEEVELVLIGEPKNWDESDTDATPLVNQFIQKFKKEFPSVQIEKVDERYTSKLAVQAMVEMGMKKKDRRKKENIDQIAAAIMLQEYLRTLNL